jgi:glycine cleavage system aminomethyltransferase T/glycine/D-amino acid oxidase-like deaminating enzyme
VEQLPESARVVIVGGGIAGCSAAYHLAKMGWRDVVLLEQGLLAGGTTWHAAGMVGRIRTSSLATEIAEYSAKLYAELESETGHSTGWKRTGSLIVARSAERMTQLRRSAAIAEYFRVEVEMLDAHGAKEKWPLIRNDDVIGALWIPGDGKVIPKDTAVALAKGAALRGATIIEHVRVLEVTTERGRVTGIRTDRGTIAAEHVVLAGGMWTRRLAAACGVPVPLYPVEHHYVLTPPMLGARDDLPCGRDPDGMIYFRGEGNCIVLGAFQAYSKPWRADPPPDFSFQLLGADWEAYRAPLAAGAHRIPALAKLGTHEYLKFVNGPESFTPDNNFIMGEAPGVRGLFVLAGFNSVGIASGGGAGKILAEWMTSGEPEQDVWAFDIRRFAPFQNNAAFLRDRVTEMLGLHYQMAWPNREVTTGRGLRKSALHDRLAAAGACFGQKMGFERPLWFARGGMAPAMEYAFGKQNWFARHAAEHHAARQAVAVFDQSSFSKYLLKGRDACTVLGRLCANEVDVPVGRAVYTAMLNARGTFESDLTAVRIAPDTYYLVTSTGQLVRDFAWITRHIGADEHAELCDVTAAYGVVGVMGPRSRELLARLGDADLSNAGFPFGTARDIALGTATVRAVRITYVGELGWELHCPVDQMVQLYDALMSAGADLGVADAGQYALNSLRLEKSYRAWGADISADETPIEAGLAFAVAFDKPSAFIGREALLAQRERGVHKRLVTFVLADPEVVLWGGERIWRDGACVGYTTSASYGHTVGSAIAMGYVRGSAPVTAEWLRAGRYEIENDGRRHAAAAHLTAPYDPKRERILA